MMSALEGAVDELEPVDLEQLDERAKLRRRVDAKYVVPDQVAAATVKSRAEGYRVLEIDGRRRFT